MSGKAPPESSKGKNPRSEWGCEYFVFSMSSEFSAEKSEGYSLNSGAQVALHLHFQICILFLLIIIYLELNSLKLKM